MRSLLTSLVAVVAIAIATATAGVADTTPPTSGDTTASSADVCARAQALFDAGLLAEAASAFKEQLGTQPCAAEGLRQVRQVQRAPLTATTVPTTVKSEFAAAVARIRRLQADGFVEEAQKERQALLLTYPGARLPHNIRTVDQPVGFWRQLQGKLGPPLRAFVEALVAVLAFLFVLWLALRAVRTVWVRWWHRAFSIAPAKDGTGDAAVDFSDVLAAELAQLQSSDDPSGGQDPTNRNGHDIAPVRRVTAGESDFSLPATVTKSYPQAELLMSVLSLLDRVLPRSLTTVTATTLPDDEIRGVGLTVAIAERNGNRFAEQTLWESDFGKVKTTDTRAARLEKLMLPAAVWLAYHDKIGGKAKQIRKARARAGRAGGWASAEHDAAVALETPNWRSFAHFALGDRTQQAGDLHSARHRYQRALDEDPQNLGALLNLAGLLQYRPTRDSEKDEKRFDLARWLLCRANALLWDGPNVRLADTRLEFAAPDLLGIDRWVGPEAEDSLALKRRYYGFVRLLERTLDPNRARTDAARWHWFNDVEKRLEQRLEASSRTRPDTAGWRWRWSYAAACWYLNADNDARDAELAERAAAQVVAECDGMGHEHEMLRPLTDAMRWPAFVLQQSALLEPGNPNHVDALGKAREAHAARRASEQRSKATPGTERILATTTTHPWTAETARELVEPAYHHWWSPSTLYTLACFYARAADLATDPDGTLKADARRRLREALDRHVEPKLMLVMADTDPALTSIAKDVLSNADRCEIEGQPVPPKEDEQFKPDIDRGHGLGLELQEALRTLAGFPPRNDKPSDASDAN